MAIKQIYPYSFKGRLYLNKYDFKNSKTITYDSIKKSAKGQVIESPRKDGFYWVRIDDKVAKTIVSQCQKNNILVMYLPGNISYKEFEQFAHSTW